MLLFNALSYPFVRRFKTAVMAIGASVAAVLVLGMLLDSPTTPDWIVATVFGSLFLAPCVVNRILFLRHQTLLQQSRSDRSH